MESLVFLLKSNRLAELGNWTLFKFRRVPKWLLGSKAMGIQRKSVTRGIFSHFSYSSLYFFSLRPSDVNLTARRLHISQDRHKVFVTVAEYDEEYIKYINNKHSLNDPPSFLVMHQFGPWDTLRKSHMRELGPILLAISLQADDESKAASLLF